MPMFGFVRMITTGLLAVAMWAAAVLLFRAWEQRLPDPRPVVEERDGKTRRVGEASFADRVSAWEPKADGTTAYLAGAALLTLLNVGGGRLLFRLFLRKRPDDPKHERAGEPRRIRRADGTEFHVEVSGTSAGPTLVLTHGWGANTTEWYYLRRQLGGRCRLVAWDLPSLGRSQVRRDKDFGLDKMAADLKAVVDEVGGTGPVILLGHSIGGMVSLTYAKMYPDDIGPRVAGLALVHTTHTNPLKTTQGSSILLPLQKPVLEPIVAPLMIGLSAPIWLMNAMSYLNGTMHWSNFKSLYSYSATWGQLEFASRYVLQVWPAHYARGTVGMFHYHATDVLPALDVPVLVVAADRDKMCKPIASRDIEAAVPIGEMVTLSPAGHMGLISSHEEFGRAVERFVDRCAEGHRSPSATRRQAAHSPT